ncbi:MAG: nicotinate phosphoribosyltransferase [Acutalibacteraceae bacterium]|uniref:nicotinate phosphoribosyltransferase n=1 Tax=Candidatus Fimenecus sp. TaxID=3022888 RepID=UPI000E8F5891|nr:nicotinate phosphoribosyltransferase [Oscillospiraceae bacterium]
MKTSDLALLTEGYELTMADGFMGAGMKDTVAYFDLFFRRVPDNGGFAIAAGLSKVIDYLEHLHFREEDIKYLKSKGISDELASYLKDFKFTCDVWAIPEGTPIFPNEPIIKVRGPIIEAQLIETMLLLSINQQSLIATKANRLVRAAHGTAVAEFGTRRAQGVDEAVYGARAAYIGGCVATSGVIPEKEFGIPSVNTMIHSWVQLFDSEYDAFCEYARRHPDDCTLVVDTYDTIRSGIPNAIKAFDDVLAPLGKRPKSVRIDSGDITYLSKRVRKMLDVAGYPDCDIMASNSLDEHLISDMVSQGAKVDCFIVGERLITSASSPLFGGVYKLSAIEKDGKTVPKINLSENVRKITIPSSKQVYRLIDKDSGKAIADVLTLDDEIIDETKPYVLFDPDFTWKRKEIENFVTRKLLVPIFEGGKKVYEEPSLKEIREYCLRQTDTLWDEVKRFENPHKYYVDLSKNLWAERNGLIEKFKGIK